MNVINIDVRFVLFQSHSVTCRVTSAFYQNTEILVDVADYENCLLFIAVDTGVT